MKYFCIATEGATSDGRNIDRQWIEQAAKNYDPARYTARINCEHVHGVAPDGPFKAYGDVVALKTQENSQGKLQLMAALDPTDELKALVKSRQKIFSSIEINPSFADTKQAYLVGLAVTDYPASLGTEMLQFCANAKESPLAHRKQHPGNLFTVAEETELEFSERVGVRIADGITKRVKTLLARQKETEKSVGEHSEDVREALETLATDNSELRQQIEQRDSEFNALKAQVEALRQALDAQPQQSYARRTPATGGDTNALTDC